VAGIEARQHSRRMPTKESWPFGLWTLDNTGPGTGGGLWYGSRECCELDGIDGINPCETAGNIRDIDPNSLFCIEITVGCPGVLNIVSPGCCRLDPTIGVI
jgi:hypothetical protein